MLRDIINDVISKLRACGIDAVYSAFDAADISKKEKELFTVVGIGGFESSTPIYSPSYIYIPFRADIEIRITASKNSSADDIFLFYDENIEPVIADMSGLTCSLSKMSIKFDSNIQRLVLTVVLSARGITKTERSTP
ncbi:hypothetical protein [Ruminococcus flavefaciens]|uniref:Uncharacterized protein n=1 Tax=Ruminococcus flavefaciens TaxID=1265 RepID=A0A1M7LCC7_RUMFL|nr:hypothetical protein [Ruminococcus flavefaciens]SHM75007.1 hypothetical protein SAMN04487860_11284 [Ruminococcus flavefaciens]